jgi:DNA-binding MarR family transcriptional regulator
MDRPDSSNIKADLGRSIHHINYLIQRIRGRELISHGLTAARAAVLFILKTGKVEASPSTMATRLFRSRSSVSGLLTRMENEGLIKKTKTDKSKKTMVELTKKGEIAQDLSNSTNMIEAAFDILPSEKIQQLIETLTLLDGSLKELEKRGSNLVNL